MVRDAHVGRLHEPLVRALFSPGGANVFSRLAHFGWNGIIAG
jgi:hypothetical protein